MKKTVLYDHHVKLGAKMVEFAGYMMPIQYSSIKEEHHAVRQKAGIFDVSHMGEIKIIGKDATHFLNHMFSNNIAIMTANQIQYGFLLYENGGVVDDLLVYKVNDEHYLLVVNAANIAKDFDWIHSHAQAYDVSVMNLSDEYSEVALQGPLSESILQNHTDYDLNTIKFFTFDEIIIEGKEYLVSRTGYTGEDGFEIYGDHDNILMLFKTLLVDHKDLLPCGLGARDTLRFEVALPLYGHEIDQDITPLEAGLKFAVKLDKEDFIGKAALVKQKENGLTRRLVGLEILDKGIVREGAKLYVDDQCVGYVTSGYLSPSLEKAVALALVDKPHDKLGNTLNVQVRKRLLKAQVIKKKLYNK